VLSSSLAILQGISMQKNMVLNQKITREDIQKYKNPCLLTIKITQKEI
jgi:hypothetical protein